MTYLYYFIRVSFLVYILIFLHGCVTHSIPQQSIIPDEIAVHSFNEVNAEVERLSDKYGPRNILIVLDIDDTVLTAYSDLGSDVWYRWQRDKLDRKPIVDEETETNQKVDCMFQGTLSLLLTASPMKSTDEQLPLKIKEWQSNGNVVIALTSRSPRYRAATERELERNDVDFSINALKPKGKPLPLYRETFTQRDGREAEWSYMKGIMMTTGLDKGQILHTLLKNKTQRHFPAIIFVDDTDTNIDNMLGEFRGYYKTPVELSTFIYEKVIAERKARNRGEVVTEEQATKMYQDWKDIKQVLESAYPTRKDIGCLWAD